MANGKVLTGFSLPWIALYANSGTTVTYSGGIPLARGVNVSLSVEAADDNVFYADNGMAETESGVFQSGTASVTVDGLKTAARKMLSGVKNTRTAGQVEFDAYDDEAELPYVGFGFVCRYMEDGVTTYVPVILTKVKFGIEGLEAATQEENIDWQTTSLESAVMRDDTEKHTWKLIGADQTTEEAAYAAIQAILTPAP